MDALATLPGAPFLAPFARSGDGPLAATRDSVLCCAHSGFFYRKSMRRLTAGILLFFALAGTFVPLALAATAAPLHACCLRKAHHCHNSAALPSDQLVVRATSCCNHDCCRAVTTRQWASPQPLVASTFSHNVDAYIADLQAKTPPTSSSASQSTRAPPVC